MNNGMEFFQVLNHEKFEFKITKKNLVNKNVWDLFLFIFKILCFYSSGGGYDPGITGKMGIESGKKIH